MAPALPIMWPSQYAVQEKTVLVKMLHMRECKGTPPVCHNFTRPETFEQPDVGMKHDFTNGVFERQQSMSPGHPPTINEVSFAENRTAYEVERIMDPERCEPINGKQFCVVCQDLNFSGVPDRVAVPSTATAAGDGSLDGVACHVFKDNNGTHDVVYYVGVGSGVLVRSVANTTEPVQKHVTHDYSGFVSGEPNIQVPTSCFRK